MDISSRRGFTLIELLVVISIIALLASIVMASLNTARDKGRLGGAKYFATQVDHIASDQAVGMWDFSECGGSVANDRSGNGNNGNLIASPSWPTDTPTGAGCALGLNGSSQYADFGNNSNFDFDNSTSFTISAWVKPTSVSGYMRVINNGHSGFTNGWLLHSSTNFGTGGPGTGIGGGSVAANSIYFQSTSLLSAGRWAHLAAVFDQTAKIAKIFIDGQQVNISKYSGTCGTIINGMNLDFSACGSLNATHSVNTLIGRQNAGAEWFNGSIDSVRVYSKALTASDISRTYALEILKFESVAQK